MYRQLWPDPEKGPWLLVLHLAPVSGRVECVGVEIRAFRHPGHPEPSELEGDFWQHARDILPVWSDSPVERDDLERRQPGKAYGIVEVSQDGKVLSRSTPTNIKPLDSKIRDLRLAEIVARVAPGFARFFEFAEDNHRTDVERARMLERARAYAADQRQGRGRKGYPVEHFQEVADVYRNAHKSGSAPTKAVAEHFKIGDSAAAKQVARARELGFLGATRRGVAGEHRDEEEA